MLAAEGRVARAGIAGPGRPVTGHAGRYLGLAVAVAVESFTEFQRFGLGLALFDLAAGVISGEVHDVFLAETGGQRIHLCVDPLARLEILKLFARVGGMLARELGPDRVDAVAIGVVTGRAGL